MDNTKNKLQDFIRKLSINQAKKQEFLTTLEQPNGEQTVKDELSTILQIAGLEFEKKVEVKKKAFEQAQTDLEQAEVEFEKDMANLKQEAKDLAKAISQEEDRQALEEARKKVA
jgi:hypothetical protein